MDENYSYEYFYRYLSLFWDGLNERTRVRLRVHVLAISRFKVLGQFIFLISVENISTQKINSKYT